MLYFWHSVGNQLLTTLVEHAHQPEPHRHGDLLQGLPPRGARRRSTLARTASASSRRSPPRWRAAAAASTRCRSRYYGRTYEEGKKIGWRDGVHALRCVLWYNLFARAVTAVERAADTPDGARTGRLRRVTRERRAQGPAHAGAVVSAPTPPRGSPPTRCAGARGGVLLGADVFPDHARSFLRRCARGAKAPLAAGVQRRHRPPGVRALSRARRAHDQRVGLGRRADRPDRAHGVSHARPRLSPLAGGPAAVVGSRTRRPRSRATCGARPWSCSGCSGRDRPRRSRAWRARSGCTRSACGAARRARRRSGGRAPSARPATRAVCRARTGWRSPPAQRGDAQRHRRGRARTVPHGAGLLERCARGEIVDGRARGGAARRAARRRLSSTCSRPSPCRRTRRCGRSRT